MTKMFRYPFLEDIKKYKKHYTLGILSLVAVDAINVVQPLIIKEVIDTLPNKNFNNQLIFAASYLLLMLFQGLGRYAWRYYLMGGSHLAAKDLRVRLYGHLLKLPISYFQKVRTGDLMSRATNDIESYRMALGPGILVSLDALFLFVMIVPVMWHLSHKLTIYAFCFYPFVPLLTWYFGQQIDKLFEGLQKKQSELSAYVQEALTGIRLIKAFLFGDKVSEKFMHLSSGYREQAFRLAPFEAFISPSLTLITNLGTAVILFWGGKEVWEGKLSLGTFVAFQRFVVQLSWPMEAIGWAITMTREGSAAKRRIIDVFNEPTIENIKLDNREKPIEGSKTLQIEKLSYQKESFNLELDKLEIIKGTKIALVGKVGSGKSTLLNLILRLEEPPEKAIYFQGRDVTTIPLASLRNQISSVEQSIFLFSESVFENVNLGSGKILSIEQIESLARKSEILDEITNLDKKFDTLLGERGVTLSGGQKQRVALMRALSRQPTLILLDDSFSAVDETVEKRLIENLFGENSELTALIATHRYTLLPYMDEVWYLKEGKLAAKGKHSVLLDSHIGYQEFISEMVQAK